MDPMGMIQLVEATQAQMSRATVRAVHADGSVSVCEHPETRFDVLSTSNSPLVLALGDLVLVWISIHENERGVVLGRIGPSHAPAVETEKTKETPDELVIEAKKNLTLKCGDGSITLRKDGKILIKGKDLVSQAKRMNRIKGGSVAIN